MAVPKYKRTPTKFEVLNKCAQFVAHTMRMVSNEKIFPKRYRWCVSNKIIDSLLEVMNNIQEANSINVQTKNEYVLRHRYQLIASAKLRAVFNLMEVAYNLFSINDDKIDYWTGLALDLQGAIKNWIDSDNERYSRFIEV